MHALQGVCVCVKGRVMGPIDPFQHAEIWIDSLNVALGVRWFTTYQNGPESQDAIAVVHMGY